MYPLSCEKVVREWMLFIERPPSLWPEDDHEVGAGEIITSYEFDFLTGEYRWVA